MIPRLNAFFKQNSHDVQKPGKKFFMPLPNLKSGSKVFRPRARIIRTIGRDLISNEIVAMVELIKNAYDADASKVEITFEEPLEPNEGKIFLRDDGTGMNRETILDSWFEPATISKMGRTRTKKGRRVTGEKGIGRFAAARIAQAMEMTSLAQGSHRLTQVRFDWGNFDDKDLYLDQVKCRWQEYDAPKRIKSGTTLVLVGLNDRWEENSFSRLRGELSRLHSSEVHGKGFKIDLHLPEKFNEYAGPVTPPVILGKPHYKLSGKVESSGSYEAFYQNLSQKKPKRVAGPLKLKKGRTPKCGPFRFEFFVWDREASDLQPLANELSSTVRDLRRDLDSASGISNYRDGFRVLLVNKDWLGLDLRRVQNPTLRISSNQIVGTVFISADENPRLRDQTNREGIVSSPEFDDFKETLIELLTLLEVERHTFRRKPEQGKLSLGLFNQLNLQPRNRI